MSKSLLKPVAEKPAQIRFSCPQALAARLKKIEDEAKRRGFEVDVDGPLSAALERLVSAAEKSLRPAEPVQHLEHAQA